MVAASMLASLILFNLSIVEKENTLINGDLILLEMLPYDKRSPLQGDFMILSYTATADISIDSIPHRGYCVVKPVGQNVYEKVRFQTHAEPISMGEKAIHYTTDRQRIHLGSNTFYFQEDKAALFDSAQYAGLRVDDRGRSILVGLYDQHKKLIK
jgi:uncharacterized membrane-anchored protein